MPHNELHVGSVRLENRGNLEVFQLVSISTTHLPYPHRLVPTARCEVFTRRGELTALNLVLVPFKGGNLLEVVAEMNIFDN